MGRGLGQEKNPSTSKYLLPLHFLGMQAPMYPFLGMCLGMYAPLPFPRDAGSFTFSQGCRPIYLFLGMQALYLFLGMQAHLPFSRDVGPLPFPRDAGPFTFSQGCTPLYLFLGTWAHLPFPRDIDPFTFSWGCRPIYLFLGMQATFTRDRINFRRVGNSCVWVFVYYDAQPFKVPCEQSENIKRCRVNVVSGQNFHFVENSAGAMSTQCCAGEGVQLSLKFDLFGHVLNSCYILF